MSLVPLKPVPPGTPFGLPVPPMEDPGERVAWMLTRTCCIWTPGLPGVVARWGLRVIPCVQPVGAAGLVRPLMSGARADGDLTQAEADATLGVFAQNRPGDKRAARAYGLRCIMNVEASSWRGHPSEPAAALDIARECALGSGFGGGVDDGAPRMCSAVTGHGFILRRCQPAMRALAAAGLIGIFQAYDDDGSADPRQFIKDCVRYYQDAGFREIVGLVGVGAHMGVRSGGGGFVAPGSPRGLRHVRAMADACEDLGHNFHVWRYGEIAEGSADLRKWIASLSGVRGDSITAPTWTPPPDNASSTPSPPLTHDTCPSPATPASSPVPIPSSTPGRPVS